jgi:hypothetical protein
MRRTLLCIVALAFVASALVAYETGGVHGASAYADPAFQSQWQQGEALTPNFWGPLATAHDGQQEPYVEAQGGQRLVQYFDKGRMELTNGTVTNGLLASEIVKGQVQVGNAAFQPKAPPAIPIAGDPDNPGPTYAQLGGTASRLLTAAQNKIGAAVTTSVDASGNLTASTAPNGTGPTYISAYDDATQHNVPQAFADYRNKAGLLTIGLGISEPFMASVKVAGQQKSVMVQVFERRVLTYTASNPAAFQVEMGNIGAHYYQWRYTGAPVTAPSASVSQPSASVPVTVAAVTTRAPLPNITDAPAGTLPAGLSLPNSEPALNTFPQPPPYTGPIYKCSDFPNQAAAQAYLRLYPTDPSHLDPNETGVACPNNPGPFDRIPVARR